MTNLVKLVFRIKGIPPDATERDLKEILLQGENVEIKEMTIAPSCYGNDTQTAIVQFEPSPPTYLEKVISGSSQDYQVKMGNTDINIDKDFYGLTQLYRPRDETEIEADIVAVTGLAGHAFGSWRGKGNFGRMWLRDFFSKDLPNCRTMIYGHNSALLNHGTHQLKDYNRGFIIELKRARSSNKGKLRPIFFIGHSFGGIIITQSLVECKAHSESDTAASDIFQSTYATAFFGTPHRGLLSISAGDECILQDELEKFIGIASGLKVLSFYERMKSQRIVQDVNGSVTRTGQYVMSVGCESALLNLDSCIEKCIPVDADHTNLVKLNSREDAVYGSILYEFRLFLKQFSKEEEKVLTRHRTIPHSVSPQFTGRTDIIKRLKGYFSPLNSPDLDQRLVFVLYGMGGSGKTQISLEFIRKYGNRFWGLFWVDASTSEMAEQSFCDIARELNLAEHTSIAAKRYLESCKKDEQWLLVIDNADDPDIDLEKLLPRGNRANILVTTRNPECRFYSPDGYFEVDAMDHEEAVNLLLKMSESNKLLHDSQKPLAAKIVHELGHLALAITHAGAFIASDSTMEKYLEYLRHDPKGLFNIHFIQGSESYRRRTVFTTWELSFYFLNDPSASGILQIFAFFHYDRIPKDIFMYASENLEVDGIPGWLSRLLTQRSDGTWNPLNFDRSIRRLRSFSLIKQDVYREKIIYSVHPLVHTWCRERLDPISQGSVRKLASILLGRSAEPLNSKNSLALIQLMPHIESCKRDIPAVPLLTQPESFWKVYTATGKWKRAEEILLAKVDRERKDLGEEHPDTLISMDNLAWTYLSQGKLAEAERLELVVLEVWKRVHGEEHPDTLASMSNLASTYLGQRKFAEAECLQLVILDVWKRVPGKKSANILTFMSNLASTYLSQGKFAEAERFQVTVLEAWKGMLGEEHPDTLTSMSYLASTYQSQGKLAEAERLHVVVLEARKRVLGEEHPDTLTSMRNLASSYRNQGKLAEAERLHVVVLEARKRVLGEEHPDTLTSMSNLASTYQSQGKLAEAERLQVTVLNVWKGMLGEEHPDTLALMCNLASTYLKM